MTDQQKNARFALAVLFGVNLMNFFDRQIAGVLAEPIRLEFGLSDTQIGLINTAFTLVYAFVGVPLGRLTDTWARTRLIAIGVQFWSVLTAVSGLAVNFGTYMLARIGVGSRRGELRARRTVADRRYVSCGAARARDVDLHDGSAARSVRGVHAERQHRESLGMAFRVLRRLHSGTDPCGARVVHSGAEARGDRGAAPRGR